MHGWHVFFRMDGIFVFLSFFLSFLSFESVIYRDDVFDVLLSAILDEIDEFGMR